MEQNETLCGNDGARETGESVKGFLCEHAKTWLIFSTYIRWLW